MWGLYIHSSVLPMLSAPIFTDATLEERDSGHK